MKRLIPGISLVNRMAPILAVGAAGCGTSAPPSEEVAQVTQRVEIAPTRPFTFKFKKVYVGEDSCGPEVEPEIRGMRINGQLLTGTVDLPDCDENSSCSITDTFTVDVPNNNDTVHVYAELWDDDDGFCGSDNHEFSMNLWFDPICGTVLSGMGRRHRDGEETGNVTPGATKLVLGNWGYEWELAANTFDGDSDGIPDCWEKAGVGDFDGDGIIDINLTTSVQDGLPTLDPTLAADPMVPDIYVEIDWMDCNLGGCEEVPLPDGSPDTRRFRPDVESLSLVRTAFLEHGYRLHFVMSEGLPVSGVLLQVDESEVNPPQNTQNFEYFLPRDDFSVVRRLYLNHLGNPGDSVATVDAKRTFFRYGIYNHSSTRRGGRTHGRAWDFGDIFHVAHDPSQIPRNHRVSTWNDAVRLWADVTMHELGHTLGLRHGGHDDNAYKPNYFSVMSYMGGLDYFDTPGHDRVLNYSELPNTLDELNLDERVPVLPLGSPDYAMSWSCPSPAMTLVQVPGRARNGVDWNCDSSSSGFVGALDVDQSRVCVKAENGTALAAVLQGDDIIVGGRIVPGADGVLNTWPMSMGDLAVNGDILAGSDNILNTVPHEDDVVVDQWIMDGGNRICDSAAAGNDVAVRPVNSEQERFIEAWNDWEHLRIPLKGNGVSGAFENVEVELSPEAWNRMGEERNLSDLVLTATESLGVGRLGRSVALTYVISNSGPNAAILPMINLHLPSGVDLVACGAELGTCQQIGNVVAVTVDHLLVGEEAVVVIEVAVDCTVAPGSKLEFVATLESRSRDLARESNVVSTTVSPVSFLGFEDASRPWATSPGGSPVPTTNVNVSEGNSALSLACGYRQFESPTFDTVELGSVGPELSVDVYVPNVQSPWVGELALIVDIPSGQLWDQWINQVNLGALPRGSWQTVTFTLPSEVVAVLVGNFPDARIKLALNHGLCGADVLVDS